MICLLVVFSALSLNHYFPSSTAYGLVAFTSGMALAIYGFKQLWAGLSGDWIGRTLVGLVFVFTVVLPAIQLLTTVPSLYVSAMIFGGLLIGVVRDRLPDTLERARVR